MSTNYSLCVTQIAQTTVISSNVLVNGDTNFGPPFPAAIDYAEGRIYRDLDLPVVRVTDTSVSCSSGVRTIALSTTQGTLLTVETLNIFSSAGTTSSNATRIPLTPVGKAVMDAVYPSATVTGLPTYFARITDTQITLGPTPDQAYGTEVVATIRPAPLSASNSSTWLTQNLPDLFNAALMVYMAGNMRDFGSQSDNPQMSQSWESQYQTLVKSAMADSQRMKFMSVGWTADQPAPAATPPRA